MFGLVEERQLHIGEVDLGHREAGLTAGDLGHPSGDGGALAAGTGGAGDDGEGQGHGSSVSVAGDWVTR